MTAEKLTVGQEVRVSYHGRSESGTVTKVGRKYATIAYGRGSGEFDMATRLQAGHQVGVGISFVTLDEAALNDRWTAALNALADHGVRLDSRHGLPLEQLEAIAALLSDPSPETTENDR